MGLLFLAPLSPPSLVKLLAREAVLALEEVPVAMALAAVQVALAAALAAVRPTALKVAGLAVVAAALAADRLVGTPVVRPVTRRTSSSLLTTTRR